MIRLNYYFKAMYGKVIGVKEMMTWEDEIPICFYHMGELCPPVFFDMMAHLYFFLFAM
jgi:hypothetical protein